MKRIYTLAILLFAIFNVNAGLFEEIKSKVLDPALNIPALQQQEKKSEPAKSNDSSQEEKQRKTDIIIKAHTSMYKYFDERFPIEKIACEKQSYNYLISSVAYLKNNIQNAVTNSEQKKLQQEYDNEVRNYSALARAMCIQKISFAMYYADPSIAKIGNVDRFASYQAILNSDLTEAGLRKVKEGLTSNPKAIYNSDNEKLNEYFRSMYFEIFAVIVDKPENFGCERIIIADKAGLTCTNSNDTMGMASNESDSDKSQRLYEMASKDSVALALNYASGISLDDRIIPFFYYPKNTSKGNCIYELHVSQMGASLLGGLLVRSMSAEVDLNKYNTSNVAIYKINGVEKGRPYLKYQSTVEGLDDKFTCDSNKCNADRLRSAWNLVAKTCKGVKTPF
jgi:hypothetical protein